MTTQILLIVVAVAALLGGILAWDILVPPSLPTLRVELDGMAPEIGKPLSVRAVEEATGIEAAREELAAIRDPQFEIRLPNLHPERRYVVDIYVDHNGNRQYDPPPEDHAWRKVVEIGEGDERATFTLGTDFTDVRWPEAASAPMIVDGRIAPGEYAHTMTEPDSEIQIHWRNGTEILHVGLISPGTGWVAIGFDPVQGMEGANIIIGAVANGNLRIEDQFASDPLSHTPDGSQEILESAGTELAGRTIVEFAIPLDSVDPADRPLTPGERYPIIVAYHTDEDAFTARHTVYGTTELQLD